MWSILKPTVRSDRDGLLVDGPNTKSSTGWHGLQKLEMCATGSASVYCLCIIASMFEACMLSPAVNGIGSRFVPVVKYCGDTTSVQFVRLQKMQSAASRNNGAPDDE